MGHGRDYIVAHHPLSLSELRFFADLGHILGDGPEPGRVRSHGSRPGGWHTLEFRYGLRDGEYWLGQLVAGTRAPVMIASFFQGELCAVRGLEPGPHSEPWSVRLHAASAPLRYPVPRHRHLYPGELPPEWMISDQLLSGAPAVDAIARWSAATGGEADRTGLAAVLAEEPEHFTDDVFFRLLDMVGLSEQVEPWYPHEVYGWDDPAKLERSIAALQPGRYRALDCGEHLNCYALVRMRQQGDYVVEYREPKPEVLYQTTVPSLVAVTTAMNAWARGEVKWRDDFEWTPVRPPVR